MKAICKLACRIRTPLIFMIFVLSCVQKHSDMSRSLDVITPTSSVDATFPTQEIGLNFAVPAQQTVQYKFCERQLSCPVFSGKGQTFTTLVFQAPSVYSARVCDGDDCQAWQTVLLHPVNSLNLLDPTPQSAQTLVFANDENSGMAISNLGPGQFLVANYMNLQSQASFGLTATPVGIANIGNSCYLNSALQLLARSANVVQAAQKASSSAQNKGRQIFAQNLSAILQKLNKGQSVSNSEILQLMQSYDQVSVGLRFGAQSPTGWVYGRNPNDTTKFLEPFLNILDVQQLQLSAFKISSDSEKLQPVASGAWKSPALTISTGDNSIDTVLETYYANLEATNQAFRILAPAQGLPELTLILRALPNKVTPLVNSQGIIHVPLQVSKSAKNPTQTSLDDLRVQAMQLKCAIVLPKGHYYSYVFQNDKWYKLDDARVTEVTTAEAMADINKYSQVLHFEPTGQPLRAWKDYKTQQPIDDKMELPRPFLSTEGKQKLRAAVANVPSQTSKNRYLPAFIALGVGALLVTTILVATSKNKD